MTELHEKYAPFLNFEPREKFFPMRVDDYLSYCTLYQKGQHQPVVKLGKVTKDTLRNARYNRATSFLRTVSTGPLFGEEVITNWSDRAIEMIYRWTNNTTAGLARELSRKAYTWLNPQNEKGAELFWWNSMISNVLKNNMKSKKGDDLPRLTLPLTNQADALAKYQEQNPGYTYYYRETKDGRYLCLQYWFFYSYNDWGTSYHGMNDHEGDWEGIIIFFELDSRGRPQEPPAYITYADHESRQTKHWADNKVIKYGTHPVGFVAAGSHATYPQKKAHALMELYGLYDYATGDGNLINHHEWVHRIDLSTVPWLGEYTGSWGTRFWINPNKIIDTLRSSWSTNALKALTNIAVPDEDVEIPGVSAPRGPLGPHREQYAQSVKWAGVPLP